MCNKHLSNSVCYLRQNHPELHCLLNQNLPEPHQLSAPKQSGSLSAFCHYAIELSTNLAYYLRRNPPNLISHPEPSAPHRSKPHQLAAPEPSGTSSAICTKALRNFISFLRRILQNFISHLLWNPPEFHQPSAPEPSEPAEPCLLSAPDGTLWNFINFLHRNPPEPPAPECREPHQLSPPEPSGTSSSAPEPSGTLRNLLRNLLLQLRRIAPELFWAKDPIATFAVGKIRTWSSQYFSNLLHWMSYMYGIWICKGLRYVVLYSIALVFNGALFCYCSASILYFVVLCCNASHCGVIA